MALLVFLAGAARAGFVAAHFAAFANHGARLLRRSLGLAGAVALGGGRGQLFLLRLHFLGLHAGFFLALGFEAFHFVLAAHFEVMQHAHQLMLDLVEHGLEQLERFFLVFLLGVLLGVAAQMNALAQMVHVGQVFFPVAVEDLQHQVLLDRTQGLGADLLFLASVIRFQLLDDALGDALDVQAVVFVQPLTHRDIAAVFRLQAFLQPFHVPLVLHGARRHVAVHHLGNHVAADAFHRGRQALGLENLLTLAVHHAALVVGHVVVFQQVLTDVEVTGFHLALGVLDGAGHPAVFDGFAVLEAQ